MILDRTRSPATIDLQVAKSTASIALVTQQDVKGKGSGTIAGESAVFDLAWELHAEELLGNACI